MKVIIGFILLIFAICIEAKLGKLLYKGPLKLNKEFILANNTIEINKKLIKRYPSAMSCGGSIKPNDYGDIYECFDFLTNEIRPDPTQGYTANYENVQCHYQGCPQTMWVQSVYSDDYHRLRQNCNSNGNVYALGTAQDDEYCFSIAYQYNP